MGIYCTVFYHQQQVMRFFQLLPFITTLCSNETLSCKNPLLAVGNKTQCSKYPLQLASGFITDFFTKSDRLIKKTEKICKRLLHPKSITKWVNHPYRESFLFEFMKNFSSIFKSFFTRLFWHFTWEFLFFDWNPPER